VSYIDSEVKLLGSGETAADVPLTGGRQIARLFENERSITGQSDWLGNVLLSYEDPSSTLTASLAYNYTGERIVLVGSDSAPDIVEESRGRVDLLVRYNLEAMNTDFELELKAANVLDSQVEWTQGGLPYEKYDPGVTYSFGLRATF